MGQKNSTRRGFLTAVGAVAAGSAWGQAPLEASTADGPFFSRRFLKDIAEALLLGTTADPKHERVLIRITRGTGQLSDDRQFISLRMRMYNLDGRRDGYHEGVWQALFVSPEQLLAVPPQPTEPLNLPVGPVQSPDPLAKTKAHWTFGDGSRLYAEGPALTHLVLYPNYASHFSVACSQILTEGGTGYFEGAQGLKQSLGATAVAAGVNFFDPSKPPPSFTATTIDTFRIVWPNGVPRRFGREYDD
jgi:hypothetical protein